MIRQVHATPVIRQVHANVEGWRTLEVQRSKELSVEILNLLRQYAKEYSLRYISAVTPRHATPILTNSAFDALSSPSKKNIGWMKIADLISFESNQLVFQSLNNQAPQYKCNLFQRNSECSSCDLRNTATDLRLPMYTSSNGQKSFSYRGATLWNIPAIGVKQAPSLSVFKQRFFLDN